MWQDIINQLVPVIVSVGVAVLSAIGIAIKGVITRYADTGTKKKLVETTVKYVEQVFTDLHGQAKFDMALQKAEELFKEKGIKIGKTELEMMIEEVVNNINNSGKGGN